MECIEAPSRISSLEIQKNYASSGEAAFPAVPLKIQDSIATYVPIKPILPLPEKKRSLPENFVSIVDRIHESSKEALELDNMRIETLTDRMLADQKKRIEKLKEAAEKASQKDTWSALQSIASCLIGAASIISGMAVFSTMNPAGMAAGSLLVASGIGSISSALLNYFRYDPKITGGLALASAGLSLLGGGLSYFVIAHQLPQLLTSILNGAIAVTTGMSHVGGEYTKMLIAKIDAELAKINLSLSNEEFKLTQIGESSKETASVFELQIQVSKAIANYQKTLKEINQTASHAV